MAKSYWIRTFGCQMNEHDSERMAGLLEVQGYRPADSPEGADVVIFNTCAIRENADERLYGNLGRIKPLKAERPEMKVIVGGCLAEKDRELIVEKASFVDVVFGTRNLEVLPGLLRRAEEQGIPVVEFSETLQVFPSALPARRGSKFHAWIAIQYGCNNSCTFCIVPSVRGKETSRRLGDIVGEVREVCSRGAVEVTLLGQNVDSYGRDIYRTPKFAELLMALNSVPGLKRVRYTSPHPKDFRQPVARAMAASGVVCEHLHLPMQSGSNSVLRAMKRSYTAQRYLDKLAMARDIVGDLAVTTDIIVGFPEETESDFQETLKVVAEARFDAAFTFQYSPRPGTEAAGMAGQIPKAVVQDRFDRLAAVQREISHQRNREEIGKIREVLVEGPSKRDPSRLSGRTRQNKLVHFRADACEGDFLEVEITGAAAHYLEGLPVTSPAVLRQ